MRAAMKQESTASTNVEVVGSKEQVESDTAKIFFGSFRLPSLALKEANDKATPDKTP
jgi:hypothetical protein